MTPSDFAIGDLIPHAGSMILIDKLIAVDEETATGVVLVKNNKLFSGPETQVPAWVGIEYMAQTVAAWDGFHAISAGQNLKMGMLLGTRKYTSNVAYFSSGQQLTVHIERIIEANNGLGSFDCIITAEKVLVEASLTVFRGGGDLHTTKAKLT